MPVADVSRTAGDYPLGKDVQVKAVARSQQAQDCQQRAPNDPVGRQHERSGIRTRPEPGRSSNGRIRSSMFRHLVLYSSEATVAQRVFGSISQSRQAVSRGPPDRFLRGKDNLEVCVDGAAGARRSTIEVTLKARRADVSPLWCGACSKRHPCLQTRSGMTARSRLATGRM